MTTTPRNVILGGGLSACSVLAGFSAGSDRDADLLLVTSRNHMTYQPFLATLKGKVRIGSDWALAALSRRGPVSCGAVPETTQSREEPEEGPRDHATAVAR